MLKRFLVLSVLALLCANTVLARSPLAAEPEMATPQTIREALQGDQHPLFLKLVSKAKLDSYLEQTGVTFLVPAEECFESLEEADFDSIAADRAALEQALKTHTLPGVFTGEELSKKETVKNLAGESLYIEITDDGEMVIDGLTVIGADLRGSNFMLHEVDDFLYSAPEE